jgi:hypothetical protein
MTEDVAPRPAKIPRIAPPAPPPPIAANVIIQFTSADGTTTGAPAHAALHRCAARPSTRAPPSRPMVAGGGRPAFATTGGGASRDRAPEAGG